MKLKCLEENPKELHCRICGWFSKLYSNVPLNVPLLGCLRGYQVAESVWEAVLTLSEKDYIRHTPNLE